MPSLLSIDSLPASVLCCWHYLCCLSSGLQAGGLDGNTHLRTLTVNTHTRKLMHTHSSSHCLPFCLSSSSEVVMCCSSLWGLSSTSYSCSVIAHQLTSQSENINQDTLRHCCPQVSPLTKWLFWEETAESSWFLQDFKWFARWQITGYFSGSYWWCIKVWQCSDFG